MQYKTTQLVAVESSFLAARDFTAWIRRWNQIKSRDGFSAAARADVGPARRVPETAALAMIDDVGKAKIVCRALFESAVIQADTCVVEEG